MEQCTTNAENGQDTDILQRPTLQDLRHINDELGMMCSEGELREMAAMHIEKIREMGKLLQTVREEPEKPLAKYPRGPGFRPAPCDNPHNAWAWRCDIPGAACGQLAGRTVAVKDNVAVAGVPMRCGSKVMQNYVPDFDAAVVTRILDAGGRVTGKSGMEELGMTGSSVCSSDDVITNPWDTSRDAGGSSSGSAALVASGHVDMAIGGDQGGSVRIPASFTGIVGLKPTWGLVPYTGAVNVEHTVDHLGPMASSVHDCALLLEVIAGYDGGKDPRQFPTMTVPEYTKLMNQDVRGKSVGLLKEGFELCSEKVVHAVVMDTAQALTQAGCIVKETSVPLHKAGKHLFSITAGLSRYKTLFEYSDSLGVKGIHHTSLQLALQRGIRHSASDFNPLVKSEIIFQRHLDSVYGGRWNAKGRNLVHELDLGYDAALGEGGKGVDVLVMPTVPHLPPLIPPSDVTLTDLAKHAWSNNANTIPFNLTGHPAITVNAGFSPPDPSTGKGRLPIGLMIVGRKFDEVTVLQMARAVEKLGSRKTIRCA